MTVEAATYRFSSAMRTPDLLTRVERGESAAVAELYDRHHGVVRAFATRLLGDPTAAEDLVHDVFLALPKAIRRFRGDSSLRTFMIGIAVNHARHHVRAATRRRAAVKRYSEVPRAAVEGPEQQAARSELAAALARAMESLPLPQRVAFVLCDVEERSSVEAAGIVGVAEGTIRSRLFHARRKLRSALGQEGYR